MKSPKTVKMISSVNWEKNIDLMIVIWAHYTVIGRILRDINGGRGVIEKKKSPFQVCSVNDE